MPFTIFLAWQMDRPTDLNRWFIDKAIKMAIRQIKSEVQQDKNADVDLKLEEALAVDSGESNAVDPEPEDDSDIVLQWGARGEVGATLIAETILQRIETCDVFIADLTAVVEMTTADGRRKVLPNSNVLIETGAAARTGRRWDRMVLVLNHAFGSVDELPFDLKHRSCKVQYHLDETGDGEKGKKRKQLAIDIAEQLRPMYRAAMDRAMFEKRQINEAMLVAVRSKAKQLNDDFRRALIAKEYHDYTRTTELVTIAIVPMVPLKSPLKIDDTIANAHTSDFAPPRSTYGTVYPAMRSMRFRYMRNGPTEECSMSEVTNEGSVLAVDHWYDFHGDGQGNKPVQLPAYLLIPTLLHSISRYIVGLKKIGVDGPWLVTTQLMKFPNHIMVPYKHCHELRLPEPCKQELVQPDPIEVPAEFDAGDRQKIAMLFRPMLDQIWRAFGVMPTPGFQSDGTYLPLQDSW